MTLLTLLPSLILAGAQIDARVDGEGYLRFVRDGRVVYAKAAKLVAEDGKLRHASGAAVLPTIPAPSGLDDLEIDLEGNVAGTSGGRKIVLGRLVLALFEPGAGLSESDGLLVSPERPRVSSPGDGVAGVIRTTAAAPEPAPPTTPKTEALPAQKGATVVAVRASSQVGVGTILLGEIAKIEAEPGLAAQLAAVSLGDTPPLGVARVLDRERVLTRIRAARIETADLLVIVPEKAEVKRKASIATHAQFVEAALAYAAAQTGGSAAMRSVDELPDMALPEGTLELRGTSISQYGSNVAVVVAAFVDGKPVRSRTVRLSIDLAEAGVRQGSAVKVLLRSGGAVIEVTGTARKTALVGQSVQVEVKLDQRTVHTGIVTAPGVVEVKL